MAIETKTTAQVFDLRTPYLQQGITSEYRAQTDLLTVLIKVYSEGGENRMHAHQQEDHSFIVLEGEATFHLGNEDGTQEQVQVVRPYEGVMLPKGAFYWFQSSGEGNLVMLRVGASLPGTPHGALYPDGEQKSRDQEPTARLERIVAPGPGFGQ
jgi:mannose-6-phosphate isomerase-like protein (cupin superfamily)